MAVAAPQTAPHRLFSRGEADDRSFRGIVGDVQWTLPYVGLLIYLFAIITFRLPVGNIGMIVALIGVLFQRGRLRFPAFLAWFALFLGWGLAGYLQSSFPNVVWERLVDLGKLGLIALVIVNACRTPAQIRFLLVYLLLLFATHPARGAIFNYYIHGYSRAGRALWNQMFGNPNDLAALTLLPLAIAVVLLNDRNHWVRLGARASVVVLPILILMTQSRGGFIGLAAFVVFAVLGRNRNRVRTIVGTTALALAVVLVAPGGVWDRVGGLPEATETDSSARQRQLIWQVAGEIISDHPLTGVGLGAYNRMHARYAARNPDYAFAGGARDTHGTYHNLAAESGYPGLLIFLAVVGSALLAAERARRRLKQTDPERAIRVWYLEAALLGFMAAGIFATYPQLSFLYIHMAILVAVSDALRREPESEALLPQRRGRRGSTAHLRPSARRIA